MKHAKIEDITTMLNRRSLPHVFPYDFKVYRWNIADLESPELMELQIAAAVNEKAGCYPYWFGDAEGITLILGVASDLFRADRNAKRTELNGLQLITEADAKATAKDMLPISNEDQDRALDAALTRLYERGFTLCKWKETPRIDQQ